MARGFCLWRGSRLPRFQRLLAKRVWSEGELFSIRDLTPDYGYSDKRREYHPYNRDEDEERELREARYYPDSMWPGSRRKRAASVPPSMRWSGVPAEIEAMGALIGARQAPRARGCREESTLTYLRHDWLEGPDPGEQKVSVDHGGGELATVIVGRPVCQNVVVHFKVLGGETAKGSPLELEANPRIRNLLDARTRTRRARKKVEQASHANFYTFRAHDDQAGQPAGASRSFIVFPKAGAVTVTGIRTPANIERAMEFFCELTGCKRQTLSPPVVTNSTYSGRIRRSGVGAGEGVCRLLRKASECKLVGQEEFGPWNKLTVSFRSSFFPGARIKWWDSSGVANVFNNGKYTLVGVRDAEHASLLQRKLCRALRLC